MDRDQLMDLAKTAMMGDNWHEAYRYYTRVIEMDPSYAGGWFGKGQAAGWISNLRDLRLNEMMACYEKALELKAPADRAQTKEGMAVTMNSVASAIYALCRQHMEEFISVDGAWNEYVNQSSWLINLLEVAESWSPDNVEILQTGIRICRENLAGAQTGEMKYWLAPEFQATFRGSLQSFESKLKRHQPSYQPKEVEVADGSGCFVATAALGNARHPVVSELREFRDAWLKPRTIGRWFIAAYYRLSPPLAAWIGRSDTRRRYCRRLLVLPAARIARRLHPAGR